MSTGIDFLSIPLKEVATIERGTEFYMDPVGDIPCITFYNIKRLKFVWDDIVCYTSDKKLPAGNLKRVSAGEVILPLLGPWTPAALVPKRFDGMLINRHIVGIKANTNVLLPWYLALVINSREVQRQLGEWRYQAVGPYLDMRAFENIYLPLPSLHMQEKIYAEYKAVQNEIANLKHKRKLISTGYQNRLKDLGLHW
jgi:restriction endonuclease S subunit